MIHYPDDVPHSAVIAIDVRVYALRAVFGALYHFTAECFVFVARRDEHVVDVYLTARDGDAVAADLAGRFANMLADEQLRCTIAEETRVVREILFAEAFSTAEILGSAQTEADYRSDPRRIGG